MLQQQTKIQNKFYVHKRKNTILSFKKKDEKTCGQLIEQLLMNDEPIRRKISGSEITEFECGGSLIFR